MGYKGSFIQGKRGKENGVVVPLLPRCVANGKVRTRRVLFDVNGNGYCLAVAEHFHLKILYVLELGNETDDLGLAFDGNWEAMSGDVAFETELQKCINVDIRYVLFVIDKYAGATHLIDEMTLVR